MKIEQLSVKFGNKIIFDNFSYEFEDGGVYILEGASGRGKTTLFNVMSGILKQNAGNVDLEGKKIAYMFQEDRLFPDFTVLENVSCVTGETHEDIEKCKAILAKLGLENELYSYPEKLSGGMCRRVALARTLVYDADILLLDEAFKGLDEETCRKTVNTIFEYSVGKTIIIAAHMIDKTLFGNHTEIHI